MINAPQWIGLKKIVIYVQPFQCSNINDCLLIIYILYYFKLLAERLASGNLVPQL